MYVSIAPAVETHLVVYHALRTACIIAGTPTGVFVLPTDPFAAAAAQGDRSFATPFITR